MKYVFIAHSHTLCLSDIGTIDYLGLKCSDCIFLLMRKFSCDYFPKGCTIIDANAFYDDCKTAYMEINHSKRKKQIQEIDSLITSWCNDKYEVFLPHMCDPYAMLIATHKFCTKVSFVQESAFTEKGLFCNHISFFSKIFEKIKTYRVYHTSRFYGKGWYVDGQLRQKKVDTYSLYPEYYKYITSVNHIIKWPNINCDLNIDCDGIYFIMDGYVKNGMAESDIYLSNCHNMISQFHGDMNYVKFHPNQSQEERDKIISFFNGEKFNVEIMNPKIPFELYIATGKNLNIVGMTSTLLFLAKKQNHNVISCDRWMLVSPLFKKVHDNGLLLFSEYFEDNNPKPYNEYFK